MSVVLKNNALLLKKKRGKKKWSVVTKSKHQRVAYNFPSTSKKKIRQIGKRVKSEQLAFDLSIYTITLLISCVILYGLISFLF